MTTALDLDRLTDEGLIPLPEALEAAGLRSVSIWTAMRWCRAGVSGVTLEGVKVGGRWLTSPPAVKRFLAELQRARGVKVKRQRRAERASADAVLGSMGLGRESGDA